MISLTVVVTALMEDSLNQDSMHSMVGNLTKFHNLVGLSFGFAFVRIFVNSYFVVGLELGPVPATDAMKS